MDTRAYKDYRMKPARRLERNGSACAPWAMLLPDAAEGLLTDAEGRALDAHLAVCPACTEELAEAQRGLAWLTVLKDQTPEPPVGLLASILAQTTGAAEAGVMLPPLAPVPVPVPAMVYPAPQPAAGSGLAGWLGFGEGTWTSLMQPRFAMTGATAFFSICLTLNLLGISVTELNAQSLRKGGLQRSVADTGASLVRSFQGLRMVYRVESHVSEMRAQMNGPGDGTPTR